jgi:tetratricopeptide (TPR) repeat protein
MKSYLIVLLSLLAFLTVQAETNGHYHKLMEEGNFHYQNNAFEEALAKYNEVIDAGFYSAELYYNSGNCYYKLNQIPEAILYYEKALKLDPSDSDAAFNLEIANTQIIDEITPLPTLFYEEWISTFRQTFSSKSWSLISILFFWLLLGTLVTYLLTGNVGVKKLSFVALLFAGVCSLASFRMAGVMHKTETVSAYAIIFEPSVDVRSEPSGDSTRLFVIHEGLKVATESDVNGWVEVVLPDGNKGWVPKDALTVI